MPAPETLADRAANLLRQGDRETARVLATQAVEADVNCALGYQVLGMVALGQFRPYRAVDCLSQALALTPDLVGGHCELGAAYTMLGETCHALEAYNTEVRLCPNHVGARFSRAQAWLKQGRFREGWLEYEWRWRTDAAARPNVPRPSWSGCPVEGKSILVHTEQGHGDTIQFIRMLPLLQQRGARVVFACQKPLHQLLRNVDGVDEWYPIDETAPITFDWCAGLLSLPGLLGINEERLIPAKVPYLFAEPERVEKWRQRMANLPGFKVGINWQGKPSHIFDPLRSMPLENFAPLAQDDVSLVSLHKGVGEAQIEPNRERVPLTVFPDLDEDGPFLDTAALMVNLDLIISVDTATAHLAGALGCPVWQALSTSADWRHLEGRTDSPWYPNLRNFCQQRFNRWEPVMQAMADELHQEKVKPRTKSDRGPASVMPAIPISVGELIDKITILQIKSERIVEEAKLRNVRAELETLLQLQQHGVPTHPDLPTLTAELKQINEQMWDIEDAIRQCEHAGDFGEKFVDLARSVYKTNGKRSDVKRRINDLLGSTLVEEKSYADQS